MCVFLCVRVLAGYNGTIFAYGQTNSGKTFTITGGARSYGDRGIIPRTLSYLYQHIIQVSTRAWMADKFLCCLDYYDEKITWVSDELTLL